MDHSPLPPAVDQFVQDVGGGTDPVRSDMEDFAQERSFPIVGPAVGRLLRMLTRVRGADRVFEFGSGFGYSAYWFAGGLAPDGEVVLTERDSALLERARSFLDAADLADRATFETGDALAIVEDHRGPFDVVLLDHEKERYSVALERVRPKLSPGALVVADNAMTADIIDLPVLAERMAGGSPPLDGPTDGIATYLETVTADPAFETVVVPLGDGVALSQHVGDAKD